MLAIDELNAAGGVLGRRIEPVVSDAKSDLPTFSREAERLIAREQVAVVFGCWTSASRKTVKPVIEKYDNLLFYPVQYEGLEQSPNIIYTGAAPNQRSPAVKLISISGTAFFLVGRNYVFPRTANAIIKAQVLAWRTSVGEEYRVWKPRRVVGVEKIEKSGHRDLKPSTAQHVLSSTPCARRMPPSESDGSRQLSVTTYHMDAATMRAILPLELFQSGIAGKSPLVKRFARTVDR